MVAWFIMPDADQGTAAGIANFQFKPGSGPTPWWFDEAVRLDMGPIDTPELAGDVTTDVVIVGGGYTGLWTAQELRRRNRSLRIIVLEADRCGLGPSGRNGGILHGYWTKLGTLRRLFGDDGAVRVAKAAAGALDAIDKFSRRRDDDFWLERRGLIGVSAAPSQDEPIRRLVLDAREIGFQDEVVEMSSRELDGVCTSPAFRFGVFIRGAATVQPARLVRSLMRDAIEHGIGLYERTPVLHIDAGDTVIVKTASARIRAESVVLAVGAYAVGWPYVARHLTNFGSYIVLTEPVPELLAQIGWTRGQAFFDGRMFVHYFRTTRDGRVLMGSGSGRVGRGGRIDKRFFEDRETMLRAELGLRRLLPGLREARIERAWGGPIDVAADQVPFFGSLSGGRVHFAAGFSGHGIGPSWLGGQILASLALHSSDEWTALPLVHRAVPQLPPTLVAWLGGSLVRRSILAREAADEDGRQASIAVRTVAQMPERLGLRIGVR